MRRLILLFLLVPACALAQSGVWGLRGITRRFVVHGNVVYAVDGRGVTAYDATTLTRLETIETDSESLDAAFTGDTLVVLTRGGLERFPPESVVPIARQEIPPSTRIASNGQRIAVAGADGVRFYDGLQLVAFWPQAQTITALAWHNDALFVATASSGVPVLDGRTATQITTIGESALDLAVDGDLLYTASGRDGLAIYDVSDPGAPRFVSRTAESDGFHQLVAASGGRAITAEVSKSVRLFDVSEPATPRAFPSVAQPVEAIAASGTRLFIAGSIFDANGIEKGSGVPLRAYDVAQAEAPRLLGEVQDLAGPVNGAATDGTLAFVSDPPFFRVLDVSTTAAPKEIASLRLDTANPYVKSLGSRVILYGNGTVQFIDVSNPYRPRLAGTFDSTGRPPGAAAISHNAFLEGNTSSGFHVFDFMPDGTSRFIAGIKTHPVEIVVSGDVAYYIIEYQALGIADISVGARLVSATQMPATQLAVADRLLLVRSPNLVRVFSLADPFAPVELGSAPLEPGGVIAAEEGAAYVAANGTILRMDLANPASPSFQPTGWRVVAPSQIAVTRGKAVVADRYALRVFGPDTAPPPPPPPARRRPSRP